jgi:hypothetical protein
LISICVGGIEIRLTGNDECGEPVDGGGNTGCGGSVSGCNDFLGVEEVDTEESDRVEGNKDKGKDDGDVRRNKVVIGDLRTTDGKAELDVSTESLTRDRRLTIQVLIPEAAMIKSFLLPALSIKKNGIAQQINLKVKSVAPRILDKLCDSPTVENSCSE